MNIRYFGPVKFKKEFEDLVPVPTHLTCLYCGEGFADGDMGEINSIDQALHHECRIRLGVGSIGHQRGKCSCFGGTEEDPPEATRREAAIAAAKYFYLKG